MKATLLKKIREKWFIERDHYDKNVLKLYKKDFKKELYYIETKKDWINFVRDNQKELLFYFFPYMFIEDIKNKQTVRERKKRYNTFKKAQGIYQELEKKKCQ
jgi:hypothetical protein